ncbi:hypothetical protein GE061_002837 [Apolygus lucorum]|uniref:Uncharacterized protein n=1 Tax=Apolygus lucorum TaxID=248454 RepID=A0A6A4IYK6_APOLU|nr:hypothetical protein GE061_002837 [Apolygus lucorum]
MVRDVREVLKAMGWVEGFNIPVSNSENQRLETEIENFLHQKAEAVVKYEIAKDRLTALQRNEKLLDEEKNTNQSLIQALRVNLDSEILTVRNCENDFSKMKYDMKIMDNEMMSTGGRIKYVQVC